MLFTFFLSSRFVYIKNVNCQTLKNRKRKRKGKSKKHEVFYFYKIVKSSLKRERKRKGKKRKSFT